MRVRCFVKLNPNMPSRHERIQRFLKFFFASLPALVLRDVQCAEMANLLCYTKKTTTKMCFDTSKHILIAFFFCSNEYRAILYFCVALCTVGYDGYTTGSLTHVGSLAFCLGRELQTSLKIFKTLPTRSANT